MNEQLLVELKEWIAIPSISSGGGDPADIKRAAEWAADKIRRSGGEVEVVDTERNPLVVGELKASAADAPTVLIYGHYDVQSADPIDAWTSHPFEPEVRDDRLYGRGAADDKGNFYPLLFVACEMAQAGELPVNVRVLVEGEEEVGGDSALKWVMADERGADCAIVFDSEMLDEETPAITLAVRGLVAVAFTVTTAPTHIHSGLYGGSVLNSVHVVHSMLANVLPGPDGKLRDELRAGITPPAEAELEAWAKLPSPRTAIEQVGGRPIHSGSFDDFYVQNWAEPSLDVNGIAGGDALQVRTIVPGSAQVKLTMRLAPGQDDAAMAAELERLLREGIPDNADVEMTVGHSSPAVFDPEVPAIKLAIEALNDACGCEPALIRSGGSIPVLATFAERGIPTVLSGFVLPDDNIHGANESYRLSSIDRGEKAARALYTRLAELPR